MSVKDNLFKSEIIEKFLANPQARNKLAQSMVEPLRRRRYGGPWEVCKKCDMALWEPADVEKHSEEQCLLYFVMES